jgi:hypothetical protein
MQANGLSLPIKAAHAAQPIRGMPDQRPPLQAKAACPTVRLALPAFGCLQAVQLAAMQDGWHHIPQAGTGGLLRSTEEGSQHPRIDTLRIETLFGLVARFLETIMFSQFFGLPALLCVDHQAQFSQQAVEMVFPYLDRTECGIPLATFALTGHGLAIFDHGIRKGEHLLQLSHDAGFGFPPTAGRWRDPLRAIQTVVRPFGSPPEAMSSRPPHRSPGFHGSFHVVWCFHHEIDHGS